MKHYIRFSLLSLTLLCNSPTPQAEAPDHFRVASFNIRYGTADDGVNSWDRRDRLLIEYLRQSRFDLIGLQEALHFQIEEILEALPVYRFTGVGREDGGSEGEFSPILYRPDRFRLVQSGTFWLSDTPQAPGSTSWGNTITRICTWADFEEATTGTRFRIFNTHFDHRSQPSREKSARLLVRRMVEGDHPVILTGDLNAGEANPALQILKRGEAQGGASPGRELLRDTFRVVHPDAEDVGTFNAFEGRQKGEKIDYVLVSEEFQVEAAGIDHFSEEGRFPSDHFPVWAELKLPSP